jgi:tripartite ATP-independent transporter DctM subunit
MKGSFYFMDITITMFIPVIVLIVCFILRVPVSFSMLAAAVVYLIAVGKNPGLILDPIMGNLYAKPTLIAAPLFIFTANIMTSSKVAEYMYTFCKAIFGRVKGATAYMNILVSLIFAGMSGSAVADAAGSGIMEIEEMRRDGYDMPFACALSATTATVGPIFPPSIQMVLFAMLTGASIGKLFMGGAIPALIICIGFGAIVFVISHKRNYPRGRTYTLKEFLQFTKHALPALFTPVILLGGIYTGIVTATESGVAAALYAILISAFAYKVMGWKELYKAISDTVKHAGMVMACLAAAFALNYVVVQSGIGIVVKELILSLTTNKWVFMLLVNIVLLISGMFFPTEIATYVFTPILYPIALVLGIDLIYFGVIVSINTILGNITPPFGFLCFIVSGITDTPLQKVFKEATPMVIMLYACLFLFTYVPALVTWLPNMVG